MMSLQLNLLSGEKKTTLLNVARYMFIKELLEFFIFTCAVLAMMIIMGWFVLADAFNNVAQSAAAVNKDSPSINTEVRHLNADSKEMIRIGQDFYPLAPRLVDIIKSVPTTVKLTAISVDRANNTFAIAGVANSRDDLINYNLIISNIPWMRASETPTSQLLQKTNITFEIRGSLVGIPFLQK